MKLLSVIIVTYNSQELIEKCLNNLFLHNDIGNELEVIIVDNSNDEISKSMFAFITNTYDDKVILIKNDKNGGYGQGNNIGIDKAEGKYIVIMNPDITMTEPLFENAIEKFEKNHNIAMLGYKQLGAYNLSFYLRQEFYLPFFTSVITKVLNKLNIFNQHFMYLSGAFLFLDKNKFEQIGFFDEKIFLYCEESDISKRLLTFGFKIKFDQAKSYIHEIDGRTGMSDNGFVFLITSTIYYLEKFHFSSKLFLNKFKIELKFKKILYHLFRNQENANTMETYIKSLNKFL